MKSPFRSAFLWCLLGAAFAVSGASLTSTEPSPQRDKVQPPKAKFIHVPETMKLVPVSVQDKIPQPKVKHGRGRKVDPVKLAKLISESHIHHHLRLKALPKVTATSFDCRTLGIVPPIVDQGQCGSCWAFSGTGMVVSARMKAGYKEGPLSEQYTLDCGQNGGCNGDDNVTVLSWAKGTGLPTTAEYGPYTAQPRRCKDGVKLYKIADWGFCDGASGNGVTPTQNIKDAMVAYGPIGCAVAAGGDNFWNTGLGTGIRSDNNIDHDVILVGWDDNHDNGDGSKGAWVMRNSWGIQWGNTGYAWVKYGAYSIGTEAVWCVATALPPPPTPIPPTPPGPNPPIPPVPPTPGTVTITLTAEQVQSILSQVITSDTTLGQLQKLLGPVDPITFTPPFKLYEGSMTNPVQVGFGKGYGDLGAAKTAAQAIANNDGSAVMVHDSKNQMVTTIQPGPNEPPLANGKKGIDWLKIIPDLEKLAATIYADTPELVAEFEALMRDLGLTTRQKENIRGKFRKKAGK